MFKKNLSFFVFVSFVCFSCQTKVTSDSEEPLKQREFSELFEKILDAHGGIEEWYKYSYLEYKIDRGSGVETHRVDIKSRKGRIDKEGRFSLGFDGENIWVAPERDSFPGSSPRFTHNLHFYFFAIPFVLADPGVNYENGGEVIIRDKSYVILKATFDEGVGDAPDDQYLLYVDPNTFLIDFINYSVTYYDKSRATQYNALDYSFGDFGSLKLTTDYTGYRWENGDFGDRRYSASFSDLKLLPEVPDPSIFEAPAGAWLEPNESE